MFHGRVQDGVLASGDASFAVPEQAGNAGKGTAYVRPHDLEIERYTPGAEGIVVKLLRGHAIGPLAQLELERADTGELIEAVLGNERYSALQLREGETLVVRPKRLQVFVDAGQLRSIREAARRGYNLTEVANALFTSQPGVSRQIRELEDELGVVIFERNGKRLTGLTEPGKSVLPIIEKLLLESENLQQAGNEYAGLKNGT
eukprot:gene25359-25501_t